MRVPIPITGLMRCTWRWLRSSQLLLCCVVCLDPYWLQCMVWTDTRPYLNCLALRQCYICHHIRAEIKHAHASCFRKASVCTLVCGTRFKRTPPSEASHASQTAPCPLTQPSHVAPAVQYPFIQRASHIIVHLRNLSTTVRAETDTLTFAMLPSRGRHAPSNMALQVTMYCTWGRRIRPRLHHRHLGNAPL